MAVVDGRIATMMLVIACAEDFESKAPLEVKSEGGKTWRLYQVVSSPLVEKISPSNAGELLDPERESIISTTGTNDPDFFISRSHRFAYVDDELYQTLRNKYSDDKNVLKERLKDLVHQLSDKEVLPGIPLFDISEDDIDEYIEQI